MHGVHFTRWLRKIRLTPIQEIVGREDFFAFVRDLVGPGLVIFRRATARLTWRLEFPASLRGGVLLENSFSFSLMLGSPGVPSLRGSGTRVCMGFLGVCPSSGIVMFTV